MTPASAVRAAMRVRRNRCDTTFAPNMPHGCVSTTLGLIGASRSLCNLGAEAPAAGCSAMSGHQFGDNTKAAEVGWGEQETPVIDLERRPIDDRLHDTTGGRFSAGRATTHRAHQWLRQLELDD